MAEEEDIQLADSGEEPAKPIYDNDTEYEHDDREDKQSLLRVGYATRSGGSTLTAIERMKRMAKKQANHLKGGSQSPPVNNTYIATSTVTKKQQHRKGVNIYRTRFTQGDRLIDWIDTHNASYTQALDQAAHSGSILVGETETAISGRGDVYSNPEIVLSHRKQLLQQDLESLRKACIVEAFYCMNQLCGEGVSLSSAIRGGSSVEEPERGVLKIDVDTSMDAFYEVYIILCLTPPWECSHVDKAQRASIRKELDDIHGEVETIRTTYVKNSIKENGITERSNLRSTIQDLQHQLLKLASFVNTCIKANTEQKSWFSSLTGKQ